MKKLLLIGVFVLVIKTYSQTNKKVESSMIKINLIEPGFEYEKGISKNSTLKLGVHTSFLVGSQLGTSGFGVFPRIEGQYRYYYNLSKRANKGKRTDYNSGNYISLVTFYQLENNIVGNLKNNSVFIAGPLYGFQRTYKNRFNWGFEAGFVGASNSFGHHFILERYEIGSIYPWANFSVGWVIRNKKKKEEKRD